MKDKIYTSFLQGSNWLGKQTMRKFSIEDGFQIVMLFFRDFWWNFLQELMIEKGIIHSKISKIKAIDGTLKPASKKDALHDMNDYFFLTVSDGTSDDYFEKVIEKRMKIPPNKQHQGLIVSEESLFQLAIDFCKHFNSHLHDEGENSLMFAIEWLEDMKNHPDLHNTEWKIWKNTIIKVTKEDEKSLGSF